MVIELFGPGKLRAWLGELPDATYPVLGVVERSIPARVGSRTTVGCVALEYFRYTENTLYGLLGATFTPCQSRQVVVQVARSVEEARRADSTINSIDKDLRIGLRSEFSISHVLDGALEADAVHALGSGVLRFDCAIERTPIVMRWLAGAIVRLLAHNHESLSEEELRMLLERHGPPYLFLGRGNY